MTFKMPLENGENLKGDSKGRVSSKRSMSKVIELRNMCVQEPARASCSERFRKALPKEPKTKKTEVWPSPLRNNSVQHMVESVSKKMVFS